jgi:lipid A ethanolaminephosphotransferase
VIESPLIYWGDKWHHQAKLDCLMDISEQPISHDNVFDILLAEMQVNSKVYKPENNPFHQCTNDISVAKAKPPTNTQGVN